MDYFKKAPNAEKTISADAQVPKYTWQTVYRRCYQRHCSCKKESKIYRFILYHTDFAEENESLRTEALTNPNSEHIELEQAPVDRLPVIQVHKYVIKERSDPRTDGSDQVTPGQKIREQASPGIVPRKQLRHRHQDINNRKSCEQSNRHRLLCVYMKLKARLLCK